MKTAKTKQNAAKQAKVKGPLATKELAEIKLDITSPPHPSCDCMWCRPWTT